MNIQLNILKMYNNQRSKQIIERDYTIGSRQSWPSNRFQIPRNWLVWEWLLNWDATDSLWINNGTATNMSWVDSWAWYTKQSGSFNWTTGYVDCWNWASLSPTTAISVSAWIKHTAWWTAYERIASKFETNLTSYKWWNIQISNTGVLQFECTNTNWWSTSTYWKTWTTNLKDSKWHLVNAIFDTTNWMKLYVDWKLETIWTTNWTIPASIWVVTTPLNIWRLLFNWTWYYWNINIQNVRLDNRILSNKEIQILYKDWLKLLH